VDHSFGDVLAFQNLHPNKSKLTFAIWGFPKIVVPNNHGSFWGVLGVPPFKETPKPISDMAQTKPSNPSFSYQACKDNEILFIAVGVLGVHEGEVEY